MSDNFRVGVSHPAMTSHRLPSPHGWPNGMGIDVTFSHPVFITNRIASPTSFLARRAPAENAKALVELLELRRIEGLSPDNVVTILGPVLEAAYRMNLVKLHEWWKLWDWLAARWIRSHGAPSSSDQPTLIHCFMECSRRTLIAAGSKGMTRILEVTLPPLLVDRQQMQEWGVAEFDFPNVASLKLELSEADFVLVPVRVPAPRQSRH